MSVRKLLLFLGIAFVAAGLWLSLVWFNRPTVSGVETVQKEQNRPALLTALRPLPIGTLLREGDFGWKEIPLGQLRPGQILREGASETQYLGAVTRRDFAEGEPITLSELIKPNDRRFLSAVLRPGHRAVSISVDAPQTSSGLALPGDFVDVILTQNFGDNIATAAHRAVGETVLRNLRVVAVGQSLGTPVKPRGEAEQSVIPSTEAGIPKTITMEVNDQQAQKLFVAAQLGKLQLAVRALEGSGLALVEEARQPEPTWASDVSQAIKQLGGRDTGAREIESSENAPRILRPVSSGSTIESLIRYAPPYASR